MSNTKEAFINHLPAKQVLKDILRAPEIEEEHWLLDKNLADLFLTESERIISRWGNKMGESPDAYFRTEPVKLWVGNEKVHLIVHSGKENEDFSILAKIGDQSEDNLPVLFFVRSEPFLEVRNGNRKNATTEEICSALKLLAFVDKSLSKEAAKKHIYK